jgi:hypothetical protein
MTAHSKEKQVEIRMRGAARQLNEIERSVPLDNRRHIGEVRGVYRKGSGQIAESDLQEVADTAPKSVLRPGHANLHRLFRLIIAAMKPAVICICCLLLCGVGKSQTGTQATQQPQPGAASPTPSGNVTNDEPAAVELGLVGL